MGCLLPEKVLAQKVGGYSDLSATAKTPPPLLACEKGNNLAGGLPSQSLVVRVIKVKAGVQAGVQIHFSLRSWIPFRYVNYQFY